MAKPSAYVRKFPPSVEIPRDVEVRLFELSKLARQFRSGMASSSPPAVANVEFDELILRLYNGGTYIADIARAAGVSHRAISRRLRKERFVEDSE